MEPTLFDPAFLARVRALRLHFREGARPGGDVAGRSARTGGFLEFAEHRPYASGDDPRFLDWNAAARSGRWFTKQFRREEERAVRLVVDASASMAFGRPTKFTAARRLAGALAAIALDSGARVQVGAAREGRCRFPAVWRQPAALRDALRFLESTEAGGACGLRGALRDASRWSPAKLFLLSDLLEGEAPEPGLASLRERGHDVIVVHVLCAADLDPDLEGSVRLEDAETGRRIERVFGDAERRHYAEILQAFLRRAERVARRHGAGYHRIRSDADLAPLLLRDFRGAGWLR